MVGRITSLEEAGRGQSRVREPVIGLQWSPTSVGLSPRAFRAVPDCNRSSQLAPTTLTSFAPVWSKDLEAHRDAHCGSHPHRRAEEDIEAGVTPTSCPSCGSWEELFSQCERSTARAVRRISSVVRSRVAFPLIKLRRSVRRFDSEGRYDVCTAAGNQRARPGAKWSPGFSGEDRPVGYHGSPTQSEVTPQFRIPRRVKPRRPLPAHVRVSVSFTFRPTSGASGGFPEQHRSALRFVVGPEVRRMPR